MKNTREFITLVNGMKHEALVRMFPVSERAFRRTQSRETLVVQVITECDTYRREALADYLAARAARKVAAAQHAYENPTLF